MAGSISGHSTGKQIDLQKKLEPDQLTADEHGSTQINHNKFVKTKNKKLFISVDLICVHLWFSKDFFCRSG